MTHPAPAPGPRHTSKRHAFKEDPEGDDLCAYPDCRGLASDPIHGARSWSAIERRHEYGDFRDHLDGKPIHCGDQLELQAIEYVPRPDGSGKEDVLKLPTGTRVRYEVAWDKERSVELYSSVAGYTFMTRADPWMRFRWPEEERR